jgi:hypothetical protein
LICDKIFREFRLYGLKNIPVDDWQMLPSVAETPMIEFADVRAVLEEVAEGSPAKWDATDDSTGGKNPPPRRYPVPA